jgi:flagellar biosynthetic protein FliR
MDIPVNGLWLIALMLGMARAGGWIVVVPPFSTPGVIPSMTKVAISVGLGLLSIPAVTAAGIPTDITGLIGALVIQIITGVALGLVVQFLVSAVMSAGSMIDLFGGINLPPSQDPLSTNQIPLFGQFYEQVAFVVLFASNGELLIVRGFMASYGGQHYSLASSGLTASVLIGDLSTFFTAVLEIAAPIVVVLFATQVGLAMLSKAAPQMNVYWLGFPLQAMLSLVLAAVAIKILPGYLDNIVSRILSDMSTLIKGG